MNARSRLRLTTPTRLVLDVLMVADPDDLPWGYRICEDAGLGSGTVYPILERLEQAGWIAGHWETGQPSDRPRRHFYTLTDTGRQLYSTAQVTRPVRGWRSVQPNPHGGSA
jgi:PadR family transcriptional regulator, regulatory protein PadR